MILFFKYRRQGGRDKDKDIAQHNTTTRTGCCPHLYRKLVNVNENFVSHFSVFSYVTENTFHHFLPPRLAATLSPLPTRTRISVCLSVFRLAFPYYFFDFPHLVTLAATAREIQSIFPSPVLDFFVLLPSPGCVCVCLRRIPTHQNCFRCFLQFRPNFIEKFRCTIQPIGPLSN